MKSAKRGFLAVLVALQATGCYQWVEIRPSELPKLRAEPPAGELATRDATLERPDGSLVEVGRNADVRVSATRWERDFEAPVVAERVNDALSIRAANMGKTTVLLSDVKHVEVSKLDVTSTVVVIVGPIVTAALIAGTFAFLAAGAQ